MKFNRTLLVALFTLLPGFALATGAIAVDDEVGDEEIGYGFSTGHDSKEEAQKAAMAQCRKSGNKNCRVAVWFNGCGAYAANKKHYGVGWGSSLQVAESKAKSECGGGCEIKVSECD